MAEQERLLANDQEGLKSQAVSESSSSWSCCCRSGPLRYADVGEAAEDAANALIAELSVQPTMWSPEAKDARVVDAVQRIWMAIASENPHILRLAPPRLPSKDWRRIGFQVRLQRKFCLIVPNERFFSLTLVVRSYWSVSCLQGDDPYTDMRGAGLAGFTYIARLAEEYAGE